MKYHVFGTDRTGNDVLYQALKSIRTAVVIGTPVDDRDIATRCRVGRDGGLLPRLGRRGHPISLHRALIGAERAAAACVLMVQVYLDKHAELFETGIERADLKLFPALLRAWRDRVGGPLPPAARRHDEAARTRIRAGRHRVRRQPLAHHGSPHLPQRAHLMLINTVLDFSALILYEAVLSYVGVGVDPSMNSFGGMINLARSEMIRDPHRVVAVRGGVHFHGRAGIGRQSLCRRRARRLRSAGPRVQAAPAAPQEEARVRKAPRHARHSGPQGRTRCRSRHRQGDRRHAAVDCARRNLRAGGRIGLRQRA